MRIRRLVCFLLGVWVGISLILALNAYLTFSAIDEVMRTKPGLWGASVFGPDHFRVMLRYTAGVGIANMFDTWELIQIGIGLTAAALLFLESSTRMLSSIPSAMTLLVVFLHVRITPDLAWLHRLYAFQTWTGGMISRNQFWRLHAIYELVDLVKCLFGIVLVLFLFIGQTARHVRRRRHHSEEPLPEAPHVASR
jgi:hypothetical protein